MTCTLQRGTVRRCMFNGLKNTPGWVCGPFGVHRQGREYTLTHMPSGYWLRTDLRTLREARRIIDKLLALPISWQFRNPNRVKKVVRLQIIKAAEKRHRWEGA